MMTEPNFIRRARAGLLLMACLASAMPAFAQSSRDLEDRVRRLEQQLQAVAASRGISSQSLGVPNEEAASLQARVIKLEQMVQQLTGQIEEARFRTGQLSTQVEQLSNDMNYRMAVIEQTLGGGQAPPPGQPMSGSAPPRAAPPVQANTSLMDPVDPSAPLSRPVSAPPTMRAGNPVPAGPPPMTDGSVRASTPGDNTFGALRVDESGRALPPDPNQPTMAPMTSPDAPPPQTAPRRAPNPGAVSGSTLNAGGPATDVALPDGTPKQQYDYAFDFLKRQDYARAEAAFREFLKNHAKDPLAGNAQYWLGETHYVRGDYQKAAVEFMNGYQNYPKSNKAPDNLLKLGMAMANIGQTQGACTAFGRLGKEYPDAGDQIQRSVQQERRKLKCK